MTIRKPNRMTTPKRAVLNGARTSHASMPRVRGRWRLDSGRVTARAGSHRPGGSLGEAGHAADDGLPDIAEHPGRPTVIAGLREVPDD